MEMMDIRLDGGVGSGGWWKEQIASQLVNPYGHVDRSTIID